MTIDEAQEQIVAEFSRKTDWLDKYEHLIALGRQHPPLEERYKTDAYALQGCQSRVWMRAERVGANLVITADSDSLITKGILSLVIRVLSDHTPEEIVRAQLHFPATIGLSTELSPARANGLSTILREMRRLASPA